MATITISDEDGKNTFMASGDIMKLLGLIEYGRLILARRFNEKPNEDPNQEAR